MRLKKVGLGVLSLLLCLGLSACSVEQAISTDLGTKVDLSDLQTEADVHIRDKNLLYEMYDNTEIVTMYLTVSSGNEAEGTDHTWEEVNTYSAYDYDRMGVDRYKVAGLLQERPCAR